MLGEHNRVEALIGILGIPKKCRRKGCSKSMVKVKSKKGLKRWWYRLIHTPRMYLVYKGAAIRRQHSFHLYIKNKICDPPTPPLYLATLVQLQIPAPPTPNHFSFGTGQRFWHGFFSWCMQFEIPCDIVGWKKCTSGWYHVLVQQFVPFHVLHPSMVHCRLGGCTGTKAFRFVSVQQPQRK
mgnify:CR=1 FL=1